eukprot:385392-Prymnesium_polylepis.1
MHSLRNWRLVFLGDSVTAQYERALTCAVRAANFPGGVQPFDDVELHSTTMSECGRPSWCTRA